MLGCRSRGRRPGAGAGDGIATSSLNPKPRDFRDARFYLDTNANNQTGEDVTARGVVLVKADGSMSLLVDAFQVLGEKGGFVGDSSRRDEY